MDIVVVLLLLVIAVIILIGAIIAHRKRLERDKYYAAAGNIIREDFLNYSLQNLMFPESTVGEPKSRKMMVYLETKKSGKKNRFVFDPEKKIYIGRDKNNSNIYIDDVLVSKDHCCIFSKGNIIYLQDMNSVNGTIVKRGILKKYNINNRSRIEIKRGDRILVGSSKFKIILFFYDITIM